MIIAIGIFVAPIGAAVTGAPPPTQGAFGAGFDTSFDV